MLLGSYGALCIFAKKGCLYAAVLITTLLSTGCFSSSQRKPLEDDHSETQDSETVEADTSIGVKARDSEPAQEAGVKDVRPSDLDTQFAPRDASTSGEQDAASLSDADSSNLEEDSSVRDADNPSVSEKDAGSPTDEVCSEYSAILDRESCWSCLFKANLMTTIPGCHSESRNFEDPPCTAAALFIKDSCMCRDEERCEPDTCACVASYLPTERGECTERWENYARCLISQCEGSC